MFFGAKKVIGLDIGTSSIKIAEIDLTRGGAQLISFGVTPTSTGAISGGEITNPSAIAGAIKNLFHEIKAKRKSVCTGMWGTSVIVKKISIPRVDKKLIGEQLRWEAEQYIPFDINEISLGHHLINPNEKSDMMDILLIGAQNQLVDQYSATISEAGLKPAIIDVAGFALANTFELNYGRKSDTIALLNIGAGNTNFVVLHMGEVIFSRDLPLGGANYTNEIHKELGVSIPEAESLKLSAIANKEVPAEVNTVIANANEAMTEEIRNSLDFFLASSAGFTISKCYYSGGGSGVPGLMDKLSQMASIHFEPLNPFLKVIPGKNMSPDYLSQIARFAPVVVGLALRKVGDA